MKKNIKKIFLSCYHYGIFEFEELNELCCDECGEIVKKDINGKKAIYGSKLYCQEYGVNSFATFTCPQCHCPLYEVICYGNPTKNK